MIEEHLSFRLGWDAPNSRIGRLTTVDLTIFAAGKAIWPVEGADHVSLEIQADDLLSYLTEFWKPLILRQTYPIAVQPAKPSLLRDQAEKRWESLPSEVAAREDEQISAFEEAHDLSRCFAGQFDLPPLWLVRRADYMLVETRSGLHSVPFDAAWAALREAGDRIATHLEAAPDERWSDLIDAWRARDHGEPSALLAWSASLDREVARNLANDGVLVAPASVTEAANDNDELRLAARMASALPPDQIRQIIDLVKGFPKHPAPKLDELAIRIVDHMTDSFARHRPFEQGEAAASYIRERAGLALVQRVDIFELIDSLGVSMNPRTVAPRTLIALAVWGDSHGPAVLLNESRMTSVRGDIRNNALARVTLAHELCHLLLDRGHALSAVEILHSRMPPDIESRAKAFAGELLLPARVAADRWFRIGSPRSADKLDNFIGTLRRDYGVTKSVAAWKLEHGLHARDVDLRILLDAVAPNR